MMTACPASTRWVSSLKWASGMGFGVGDAELHTMTIFE
jgi:hypothetical protein